MLAEHLYAIFSFFSLCVLFNSFQFSLSVFCLNGGLGAVVVYLISTCVLEPGGLVFE
jgi:hypothetical protein